MNKNVMLISISKWLNEYMKKNNLKPEEIAEQLDCSSGYINILLDYMNDPTEYKTINVSIDFIVKLSNVYNVKIDDILKHEDYYEESKANYEKLWKLVDTFRNKLIGEEFNVENIKNKLSPEIVINKITENHNYISFEIENLSIAEMEMQRDVNKFEVILNGNIIRYLALEQEFSTFTIKSQKQRHYFDKKNELFVSSVKLGDIPMLFNMNYETMMKYNDRFFYQDRYTEAEEAIKFNDKIFDEIVNGRSFEEIKDTYNNMDQVEEEESENDM